MTNESRSDSNHTYSANSARKCLFLRYTLVSFFYHYTYPSGCIVYPCGNEAIQNRTIIDHSLPPMKFSSLITHRSVNSLLIDLEKASLAICVNGAKIMISIDSPEPLSYSSRFLLLREVFSLRHSQSFDILQVCHQSFFNFLKML